MPKRYANYPDSKCAYGYMTLCEACVPAAPRHVDTMAPITEVYPAVKCEMCEWMI